MVATFGRAGVPRYVPGAGFAKPVRPSIGNNVPPQTGGDDLDTPLFAPGPHPGTQPLGGQLGANDGYMGADPTQPAVSPAPHITAPGEGQVGAYGGRQTYWRGGIQGFNDKLTVKDRHVYWDTGNQRQGTDFSPASSPPNTWNDPLQSPPAPELRALNRTVSYQLGTDATRNQDDLSRPYTWLGEQGAGWSRINGGVPGLVVPYGSRGGVPYPIVDPTNGEGGPELVWSGPPHGLHSLTYPDYGDTYQRYANTPQMRPARIDRPSNSPQAGQSYSQTVAYQGTSEGAMQPGGAMDTLPGLGRGRGRGWAGHGKG